MARTLVCDDCGNEFLRKDLTWVGDIEFLLCFSDLQKWNTNPEPDRIRQLIRERHGINEELYIMEEH